MQCIEAISAFLRGLADFEHDGAMISTLLYIYLEHSLPLQECRCLNGITLSVLKSTSHVSEGIKTY